MEEQRRHITELLQKIRPYIQGHGGDVSLISVAGGTVRLRIEGACVGCPLAKLTYNTVIHKLILEDVPGITEVSFE